MNTVSTFAHVASSKSTCLTYIWVPNKRFSDLLIFKFFPTPQCLFGPSVLFIIPNILLLTCTEIGDLNTNIPISKWDKHVKNMWKKIRTVVV